MIRNGMIQTSAGPTQRWANAALGQGSAGPTQRWANAALGQNGGRLANQDLAPMFDPLRDNFRVAASWLDAQGDTKFITGDNAIVRFRPFPFQLEATVVSAIAAKQHACAAATTLRGTALKLCLADDWQTDWPCFISRLGVVDQRMMTYRSAANQRLDGCGHLGSEFLAGVINGVHRLMFF